MVEKQSSFFTSLIEKGEFRINNKGQATLFGEFLLMIPPAVIVKLQDRLAEEVGRETMEEMMHDVGAYQVEQAVKRQLDDRNLSNLSKEQLLDHSFNIFGILGWGTFHIEDIESDFFRVEVHNPSLPTVIRKRMDRNPEQPTCHFIAGLINRNIESILEKDFTIEEVSCASVEGKKCVFEGQVTN